MATKLTDYKHVTLDGKGRPVIQGTRMRINQLVPAHTYQGYSAEQLREHFPHLSLPQIYGALTYYYDHKPRIDEEIQEEIERVEALRLDSSSASPVQRKLRQLGKA